MAYLKWHIEILKTLIFTFILLLLLLVYAVNRDLAVPTEPINKGILVTATNSLTEEEKIGKKLFKANCASCHHKNMKDRLTGPSLINAQEEWAEYPVEDLYRWINNPMKLVGEGHPRATELWSEWGPSEMTAFPKLTPDEIDAIFEYVAVVGK